MSLKGAAPFSEAVSVCGSFFLRTAVSLPSSFLISARRISSAHVLSPTVDAPRWSTRSGHQYLATALSALSEHTNACASGPNMCLCGRAFSVAVFSHAPLPLGGMLPRLHSWAVDAYLPSFEIGRERCNGRVTVV